jgi:hypothetical protein
VFLRRRLSLPDLEVTAHAEMYEQVGGGKPDIQELGPPAHILDDLPLDLTLEPSNRRDRYGPGPADVNTHDLASDQRRAQVAGDGFDFGKFRHSWRLSGGACIGRAMGATARNQTHILFVEHLTDTAAFMRAANDLAQQAAHREHRDPIVEDLHLFGRDWNAIGGDYPFERERGQVPGRVG